MCIDLEVAPNSMSCAKSVFYLLQSVGFNEVLINQDIKNVNICKKGLTYNFIQSWYSGLKDSM